ncbi:putative endonuclease [Orbus hercynius]|uniref:UPF0102 protein DES39_0007 n=1 Tax=Orbus hercynius TaxID=593135 RepID=A0A495RHA2_9GAMM|nr:YraN family protein [Orbus hercynius]RKS86809.1 putative endonuclease [Orbus hercynius]
MENKQQLGKYYEEQACQFLCQQGMRLVGKNSISRLGEVDLIMQDGMCLIFVEVRYRKNDVYGDAQSSITVVKQHKVINAAYSWMQKHDIDIETSEFRFDVIAITGRKLHWIKNAFSA